MEVSFLSSTLCVFKLAENCDALKLLCEIDKAKSAAKAVKAYTKLISILLEKGKKLGEYLHDCALFDDNIFMRMNSYNFTNNTDENIVLAAKHDLEVLKLISNQTAHETKATLAKRFPQHAAGILALPELNSSLVELDWSAESFAKHARENGFGIYARFKAFEFTARGEIVPIERPDRIRLHELKSYEVQRQKIIDNTEAFLAGLPASNALLYGDRGTGKSSTVKALLNEYSSQGLRIIQITKSAVGKLSELIRLIEPIALKFIVFIDDLTFNEDDEDFGVLKAALEGSLIARPENIVIYATTNRRHLVKESFQSRQGDEVHRADQIDESLSLSDRFGLYITFSIPARDEYLRIVEMLATDAKVKMDKEVLLSGAERFALQRTGRSPRIARQYIDTVIAFSVKRK